MHHCAHADGGETLNLDAVLRLDIGTEVSVAVLHTVPYSLDAVCPQTVDELVFPFMTALGDGGVVLVDENGLDSRRTEFYSENGLAFLYCLFSVVHCHIFCLGALSDIYII